MIWGFARPWRGSLALCTLLMLVQAAVSLAIPALGGEYAQELLSNGREAAAWILWLLIAYFAVQALLRFASSWLLGVTAERILTDLRARLYDHLQALPMGYYHERKKGDVLALLTNDVGQLAGYITGTLLNVLPMLFTVVGSVVMMMRIDLRLGFLVAAMVPVFYVILKVLGRELRPLSKALQQAQADSVVTAEENLGMLHTIKVFTREDIESTRYKGQLDRVMQLHHRQNFIHAVLGPLLQFLAAAGVILMVWLLTGVGPMRSARDTVSFMLYAAMLAGPVGALAQVYGQTRQIRGTLERLGQALAHPTEPPAEVGEVMGPVRGQIEFRAVVFAYPGREPALRGVNLHIRAGETVALTGVNGAGKSTLTHLLMRIIEPDSGSILVDGCDIRRISLASLRSQIGVVTQQVQLCNGTVRENIAWGNPDAAAEQVEMAARAAQAHAFIEGLPQGYDTLIGDQGIRLSGGQRQRLALARALLKDPPILILDEATAMFDPQAERSFIADCHEALSQRTVILITHRPASLALADRVLHLDGGCVAEAVSAQQDAQP